MAVSLFMCWDLPFSTRTEIPDGRCVTCTAESVTFLCCPPLPEPLHVLMSRSLGSISTSACCLPPCRTATVIVEVCILPRFSVGGILCHLWPPDSFEKMAQAFLPVTVKEMKPERAVISSKLKTFPYTKLCVNREHVFY